MKRIYILMVSVGMILTGLFYGLVPDFSLDLMNVPNRSETSNMVMAVMGTYTALGASWIFGLLKSSIKKHIIFQMVLVFLSAGVCRVLSIVSHGVSDLPNFVFLGSIGLEFSLGLIGLLLLFTKDGKIEKQEPEKDIEPIKPEQVELIEAEVLDNNSLS